MTSSATRTRAGLCINSSLASTLKDANLLLEARAQLVPLHLEIISCLQIEPELLARAEITREAECRIGGNRALPMDNLIDTPRRHADILRQPILGHLEWCEKLGGQNLAG